MCAQPVREIETLRGKRQERHGEALREGAAVDLPVSSDLLEIRAEFEVCAARAVGVTFGGRRVAYDAGKGTLEGMPLKTMEGKVRMRLLVDRPSLEVFGNDGRVCLTSPFRLKGKMESVQAWSEGGEAKLVSLEVFELKSAW
jgi:sucrose-6-phosphate hydrolase SacC (GH32 family)